MMDAYQIWLIRYLRRLRATGYLGHPLHHRASAAIINGS